MILVCPLAQLPRGEALRVELDLPIAVFHTDDGDVFAIDDTCTHQDASLADGWLEGCAVECPLHASTFDLRTGQVDVPPARRPVRTHAVTIVDDDIWVTLSTQAPNLPPGSELTGVWRLGRAERSEAVKTIAIAGGSLAGVSAARALRAEGFDGRLIMVSGEADCYDRPPLSKGFLAGTTSEADLALVADDEDLDLDVRRGVTATALDPARRALSLADGSDIVADGLVVATGARAVMPWPAAPAGVQTLRTLEDARHLRSALVPGARLVVVGAGFVGSEVAATAIGMGVDVTVVDAVAQPLAPVVGAVMASVVTGLHGDHGVRVITGTAVVGFSGTDRVTAVVLADGRALPADTVVVGVGVRPCVDWLESSGLAVLGGLQCDAWGATAIDGVVGVGDCATWDDPVLERPNRIEHWTAARERAGIAAVTLLSRGTVRLGQRPPYFWSDQYGHRLQMCGHPSLADRIEVVEGAIGDREFVALYQRRDTPVAVLALGCGRTFARWRKHLAQTSRRSRAAGALT